MNFTGQTILVTGATGFLGSVVVRQLSEAGAHVKALAHRPERDQFIKDLPDVEIVKGDITALDQMQTVMGGVDVIIHCAAALGGSLEAQSTINMHGTFNVTQAAVDHGVKRVVHVSTMAIYGYRNRQDVTESTMCDPGADPYHITKVGAEKTVVDLAIRNRIEYVIIRPGMIYGPRSQAWTKSMFQLAKRGPIWVGNGKGSAYPVFVEDVAEMCLIAAQHPRAANQIFNCTPDPSPTWREFLGEYAALAGHPKRWIPIPPLPLMPIAPLIARFAPRHSQRKDLDHLLPFILTYITYKMDKARDLLDWEPQTSLQEGVAQCEPYLREKGLL